jgi:hypothetical protein
LIALGGADDVHTSEETVDEEFTDAEIRTLLTKAASDRRRDEIRQRLARAGDPRGTTRNEGSAEAPHEAPLEQEQAA